MTTHCIFLVILSFSIAGCVGDAPHDNPADPLSPRYLDAGNLTGRLVIANQTTGIAGAVVRELSEGVSVTSDSSGYFSFTKLSGGMHSFVCVKENYTNDSFDVDIRSGVDNEITRELNGAPITISRTILTRKIDQYFPSPQYFVDISAVVSDPNGITDLDSVWFGVDTLQFPLTYSVDSKSFIATIYKSSFPTNTIQYLVGRPLTIISRDIHHAINTSDPFYITRVIENEAVPISPSPAINDTVSADSIYFKWSSPNVTFNYTYSVFVYRVDGGTKTLVWSYENLNSFYEELQYPIDGSIALLSQGTYVWTIGVVDDFGNYARSKESSFVVK